MERKNLSKTGQMLLSKNSPNRYPDDRIYKTGPNFLNKFSSRLPTDDELRKAQTSLSLLKSKMKFNSKGRGNNRRSAPRQVDDMIGDIGGQNGRRGQRGGGKGNYRKVFKPNSQLENINKREQMIMGNIDMLDDNLNMQREILGSHSHNNLPPKRGRGDKSRGQRGYGRKVVQDFGEERDGVAYNPDKYRTGGPQGGHGHGVSSTSTAHTRRKENRRAGKTPPRRYNDSFGNQREDSRGRNQPSYGDYQQAERDPFAKGDNRMMKEERDPFAKGDNRMMKEERDPFAKGDNRMMGGHGDRREEKSSRSRRNNQQKRIKPNRFGDEPEYESGGGRKRRQQPKKQKKAAWNNEVFDPYAEKESTPQGKGSLDDYEEEENTFGNPDNFSNMRAKKSSAGRRKKQSKRRVPERNPRAQKRSHNDYNQGNQRGGFHDDPNPAGDEDRPLGQGENPENDQILMEAQMAAQVKLYPCGSCGRKFKKDTLAKHRRVCKKVFKSKRPKFDDVAMRHGDDPEALRNAKEAQREIERIKKGKKKAAKRRGGFPENNKQKWKKQSEAFRAQIRMARGGKISKRDEEIVKEAANIGMVQCPHCTRSFGKKAADRHIPICGEKAKRNKYKNGGGSGPKKRATRNRRRTKY